MQTEVQSADEYVRQIPLDKREAFTLLREVIIENLPPGFHEEISYGMIGYVVPFNTYPKGYHCNTKLPLPFMNIAAQKNFIAIYHMGIYANPDLMNWFTEEFPKHSKLKLDIGKSCIRFKNMRQIPYALIGELTQKMQVADWISLYEKCYINREIK